MDVSNDNVCQFIWGRNSISFLRNFDLDFYFIQPTRFKLLILLLTSYVYIILFIHISFTSFTSCFDSILRFISCVLSTIHAIQQKKVVRNNSYLMQCRANFSISILIVFHQTLRLSYENARRDQNAFALKGFAQGKVRYKSLPDIATNYFYWKQ